MLEWRGLRAVAEMREENFRPPDWRLSGLEFEERSTETSSNASDSNIDLNETCQRQLDLTRLYLKDKIDRIFGASDVWDVWVLCRSIRLEAKNSQHTREFEIFETSQPFLAYWRKIYPRNDEDNFKQAYLPRHRFRPWKPLVSSNATSLNSQTYGELTLPKDMITDAVDKDEDNYVSASGSVSNISSHCF
jgi:hypothetical protein